MEISLPADANLYVCDPEKPLLFRIHELEPGTGPNCRHLRSWGVISGAAPPYHYDPMEHIAHWGGTDSPWVSTTTDFAYIAFEANRLRTRGNERYISVIDASHHLIKGRCIRGTEAIEQYSDGDDEDYRKAWNFARCFSEVLVYGSIPAGAIVHTFKWDELREKFPEFVNVKVDTKWSAFERYKELIQQEKKKIEPAMAHHHLIITHGISLIHDIFAQASSSEHLQVQKKHVISFCIALLEWLDIVPNRQRVEESVEADPLYVAAARQVAEHVEQRET